MNNRSSSRQYLKKKKEILQELEEKQKDRIDVKIENSPVLKLGNIKPTGISLELKAREIE